MNALKTVDTLILKVWVSHQEWFSTVASSVGKEACHTTDIVYLDANFILFIHIFFFKLNLSFAY
jgi:hypothetical protein